MRHSDVVEESRAKNRQPGHDARGCNRKEREMDWLVLGLVVMVLLLLSAGDNEGGDTWGDGLTLPTGRRERMKRALTVDLGNGMRLTYSKSDGYFLHVEHGGMKAGINLEAILPRADTVIRPAFLAWADAQLDRACTRCNGWGDIDAPYSGSDPSCPDCDGTGEDDQL